MDKNGQNSILLFGGANRSITKEFVDMVLDSFEKGDILLLQNEINELDYIMDAAYEKGIYRQGIFKVKAVDTTAAGDTFTGYFISSVLEGIPVQQGLELAAKAAAIAVSREGAAASIPLREEVQNWNP